MRCTWSVMLWCGWLLTSRTPQSTSFHAYQINRLREGWSNTLEWVNPTTNRTHERRFREMRIIRYCRIWYAFWNVLESAAWTVVRIRILAWHWQWSYTLYFLRKWISVNYGASSNGQGGFMPNNWQISLKMEIYHVIMSKRIIKSKSTASQNDESINRALVTSFKYSKNSWFS
jgi:hypothetical protein